MSSVVSTLAFRLDIAATSHDQAPSTTARCRMAVPAVATKRGDQPLREVELFLVEGRAGVVVIDVVATAQDAPSGHRGGGGEGLPECGDRFVAAVPEPFVLGQPVVDGYLDPRGEPCEVRAPLARHLHQLRYGNGRFGVLRDVEHTRIVRVIRSVHEPQEVLTAELDRAGRRLGLQRVVRPLRLVVDSGDGDTEERPGAVAGCQMQRDRTTYRVSDEDDPGESEKCRFQSSAMAPWST